MTKPSMNLTVRVSGALQEFVTDEVSAGDHENVSEYIRGLIRADKRRKEHAAFEKLKAELQLAFAASDDDLIGSSAEDVITRGLARHNLNQV